MSQLTYRGIQYSSNSTIISTPETAITAIFLGQKYQKRSAIATNPASKPQRIYRGLIY